MIIDELITVLGYDLEDEEKLAQYREGLDSAKSTLLALAAASAVAGTAIAAMVSDTATRFAELADFSATVGESVEDIQRLGFAAEQSGSSNEALRSSLEKLNEKIGEASKGAGEPAEMFKKLGVSIRDAEGNVRSGASVFTDLSNQFSGLSKAEQINLAKKLGIDASLITLLNGGSEAIGELGIEAEKLGMVFSGEAVQAGADLDDQIQLMLGSFGALKDALSVGLFPQVTMIVKNIRDWIAANREFIEQKLGAVLQGIVSVLQFLFNMVGAVLGVFGKIVAVVDSFVDVMKLLTAITLIWIALQAATLVRNLAGMFVLAATGVRAFNLQLLLSKLALGAAILFIALFIEDLIVYFKGGESVIGDFLDFFKDSFANAFGLISGLLEIFIAAFTGQWGELPSIVSGIFSSLIGIVESAISAIIGSGFKFADFGQPIGDAIDWIIGKFQGLLDFIGTVTGPLNSIISTASGLGAKVGGFVGGLFGGGEAEGGQAPAADGVGAKAKAIGGVAGLSSTNNQTATKNDFSSKTNITNIDSSQRIEAKITVDGTGKSGMDVGREIGAGLQDQSKRVRRNNVNAVAY